MKRASLKIIDYKHSATHPFCLDLRAFGQGRKFFRTRAEAETERTRHRTLRERSGRELVGLSLEETTAIIQARRALANYGKTVGDAAAHYLCYLERVQRCNVTVSELVAELLEAKRKDGRTPIYLKDLRSRLATFCRDFGERPVASVEVEEIDNWLRNLPGSPKSRANFRGNISVLFGYAEQRRMIDSNPVARTSRPKLIDKAPEILSVDKLQGLLNAANDIAPDVVPQLAIGAFAGLRDAEIKRLDWNEIDLPQGFIEVKAEKSKTAKRRVVTIQPNLAQWLAPFGNHVGGVVPINARKKLDAVRQAAALEHWPENGLRHSFASYRLAATNDSALVAAELGHSTSQMLYSTYRELVLPRNAERYWRIGPTDEAPNVISLVQSS